jgi:hypothetical protein
MPHVGQLYLPRYQDCTMKFLRQILLEKKKVLERR